MYMSLSLSLSLSLVFDNISRSAPRIVITHKYTAVTYRPANFALQLLSFVTDA